ncbi:hypothetical protein K438DRAFT_1947207 [Mycena galopus ATCC 62051]|nr:hypothetical protein K438DRAFT_1947207 [Mycena galopus ATCC 62051]
MEKCLKLRVGCLIPLFFSLSPPSSTLWRAGLLENRARAPGSFTVPSRLQVKVAPLAKLLLGHVRKAHRPRARSFCWGWAMLRQDVQPESSGRSKRPLAQQFGSAHCATSDSKALQMVSDKGTNSHLERRKQTRPRRTLESIALYPPIAYSCYLRDVDGASELTTTRRVKNFGVLSIIFGPVDRRRMDILTKTDGAWLYSDGSIPVANSHRELLASNPHMQHYAHRVLGLLPSSTTRHTTHSRVVITGLLTESATIGKVRFNAILTATSTSPPCEIITGIRQWTVH